jgi:hypothetical protein
MVLAPTIIAVALGLTPVNDGQLVKVDSAALTRQIGRYAEQTDRQGIRHLRGFDQHGRAYTASVAKDGRVECLVGGQLIEFTIVDAN